MEMIGRFRIDADHPSLPGHFPGAPVVPGVVVLDHALALIRAQLPGRVLTGVPRVKFPAPVLPGAEVIVETAGGNDGRMRFRCTAEGVVVAQGEATLHAAHTG